MYPSIYVIYFLCQSCKAVYDRIIELRIATPQIIINYGMFLEESNYFEEAFKVRRLVAFALGDLFITPYRSQLVNTNIPYNRNTLLIMTGHCLMNMYEKITRK